MKNYCVTIILMMMFLGIQTVSFAQEDQPSEMIQTIEKEFEEGESKLAKLISVSSNDFPFDNSMATLKEVLATATQRAIALSEWDIEKIKTDAENNYDTMIKSVENYLELVKDDGVVNRATIKIRDVAFSSEREYRAKANSAPTERGKQTYNELADSMNVNAKKVDEIWTAIRDEREVVRETLILLKESKTLYVDRKKAAGIENAVKELEAIHGDLAKMAGVMKNIHEAIWR